MKKFQIVRVERLKSMAEVKRSGLHTFREIETKNAIPEKFSDNEFVGAKDAEGVFQAVRTRIGDLDKKDKQACRCLEFFISASPEQFAPGGLLHDPESQKRYFAESLNYLKKKHGEENVVFHSIHRDEKEPHMIVYAVPVVHREAKKRKREVSLKKADIGGPLDINGNGRRIYTEEVPARTELSAKAYYHCPAALALLQDEFHAGVSQAFGLDRGISRANAQKHKKTWVWYAEKDAEITAGFAALAAERSALAAEAEAFDARLFEIRGQLAAIENSKQMLRGESMALGEERQGLEAEQKTLRDGQAVLAEKIQAVDQQQVELDDWRKRLDDYRGGLEGREATVKEQSGELTKKLQEVEKLQVELTGELGAAKWEREQLDRREVTVTGREEAVIKDRTALDGEFKKVERIKGKLDDRAAGLDQREAVVIDREFDLNVRETKLDQRDSVQDQREADLMQREATVSRNMPLLIGLNDKIKAFQTEKAEFRKEMEPLKDYSPVQIDDAVKSLQKAAIKPTGKKR